MSVDKAAEYPVSLLHVRRIYCSVLPQIHIRISVYPNGICVIIVVIIIIHKLANKHLCKVNLHDVDELASMTSVMVKSNSMTTTSPDSMFIAFSTVFSSSIKTAVGIEIYILRPRNSDRAVEDAPIIWFITSLAALSPHLVKLIIVIRGSSFTHKSVQNTLHVTLTKDHHVRTVIPFSYVMVTSIQLKKRVVKTLHISDACNFGVVINTCLSSIEDRAAAAEPMLIFMISLIASICISFSLLSVSAVFSFIYTSFLYHPVDHNRFFSFVRPILASSHGSSSAFTHTLLSVLIFNGIMSSFCRWIISCTYNSVS